MSSINALEQHTCQDGSASAIANTAGSAIIVLPKTQQGKTLREPDSGISSARSTATVPWSHNESGLPALQSHGQDEMEDGREEEHQV